MRHADRSVPQSQLFWENVSAKCHQKVLADWFPMHNLRWRLLAITRKWAPFGPREERQVAATREGRAVKMRSGCGSHFKPFRMLCFWHVNARPSRVMSVCGGHARNWFWRSYLDKPGVDELFKRGTVLPPNQNYIFFFFGAVLHFDSFGESSLPSPKSTLLSCSEHQKTSHGCDVWLLKAKQKHLWLMKSDFINGSALNCFCCAFVVHLKCNYFWWMCIFQRPIIWDMETRVVGAFKNQLLA